MAAPEADADAYSEVELSSRPFERLVKVAECTPDMLEDAFTFELSNVPTSLFDSTGLPSKANKAALANYIWSITEQVDPVLPDQVSFVIDGGSLLHRLTWPRGATYNYILQMYTNFVSHTYKKGTVVFDGYSYGPSTKDGAHLRRTNGGNTGPDIDFTGDMVLSDSKEHFLRNPTNKQRFINLLSQTLGKTGLSTLHAPGDADRLIVHTALDKAREIDTVLIGEDTDLLVIFLHHFTEDLRPVYFKSFSLKSKFWDIRGIKNKLSPIVCSGILFAHAVAGCDTTSSLFSIGKSQPPKKLSESESFRKQAAIFMSPNSKREEITGAGDKALTLLYGGKDDDSLDKLRYVKYMQKVATCTVSLDPSKLPPTSSAAKFHSLRTYFQVQEWLHLAHFCLVPHDWGREIRQELMFPVLTDIDVAPEALLNVIKCTCKTDCQTARCTCRRHGLVCTVACKQCREQSCVNTANVANGITVDDDEFSEEEDV